MSTKTTFCLGTSLIAFSQNWGGYNNANGCSSESKHKLSNRRTLLLLLSTLWEKKLLVIASLKRTTVKELNIMSVQEAPFDLSCLKGDMTVLTCRMGVQACKASVFICG